MLKGYIRGTEGEPVKSALLILNTHAYIAEDRGGVEVPTGEYDAMVMHKDYETQRSRVKLERDFTIIMEKL